MEKNILKKIFSNKKMYIEKYNILLFHVKTYV